MIMSFSRLLLAALCVTPSTVGIFASVAGAGGFEPVQRYAYPPIQKPDAFSAQAYPSVVAQKFLAVQKQPVALPLAATCCTPNITYRHHGCCKRRACCSCESSCQVILPVKNPKGCGCILQIPVPVPPGCQDIPCGKDRCGLFVSGVATFKWACGYRVKIILLHRGDVIVHTFGQPITPAVKVYAPVYPSYPLPAYPSYPLPAEPAPMRPYPLEGPQLAPASGQGGYEF
jgi:hypothetical protein